MNVEDLIREPAGAAILAAAATAIYIHFKAKLNKEALPTTSQYVKPAVLVAILVYVITMYGMGKRERISSEPF
jgi:hypothetical protein